MYVDEIWEPEDEVTSTYSILVMPILLLYKINYYNIIMLEYIYTILCTNYITNTHSGTGYTHDINHAMR